MTRPARTRLQTAWLVFAYLWWVVPGAFWAGERIGRSLVP